MSSVSDILSLRALWTNSMDVLFFHSNITLVMGKKRGGKGH